MNNIENKYINTFFSQLTKADKKNIFFDHYLWHAFSYKKVACLEGKLAITEFEKKIINNVYIFSQGDDNFIEKENLTYKQLLDMIRKEIIAPDCYVVDKNFRWTFVFTHETNTNSDEYYIGPFFTSYNILNS